MFHMLKMIKVKKNKKIQSCNYVSHLNLLTFVIVALKVILCEFLILVME